MTEMGAAVVREMDGKITIETVMIEESRNDEVLVLIKDAGNVKALLVPDDNLPG